MQLSSVAADEVSIPSTAAPVSDSSAPGLGTAQALSNSLRSRLPSMTIDTEPWSTDVTVLQAHDEPAAVVAVPGKEADVSSVAPASPDFSLKHQELAAEPTFSLSSSDVSPDRSSISMA